MLARGQPRSWASPLTVIASRRHDGESVGTVFGEVQVFASMRVRWSGGWNENAAGTRPRDAPLYHWSAVRLLRRAWLVSPSRATRQSILYIMALLQGFFIF